MATPNRFALRDAGKATFYNLQTGKAMVTIESLKTSGVETSGDTTYATGGFGNARLVGFSSNKQAKLPLQDALFDATVLGMLTGNSVTGGKRTIDYNEILTVTSNKVTLSKTPKGAIVSVYSVNPDKSNGTEYTLGTPATKPLEYSVSGKDITFNTDVANNTLIRVYYKVETAEDAKTVMVTSSAFGGTFKLVLDVLVRDATDGLDYAGQLVVPRGKIEDAFNISLSVDGDPAVLDIPIECLKDPLTDKMWELIIFDTNTIA